MAKPPPDSSPEIVIPDCCNIGTVFRTLIAVNAAFLAGILLRTGGWRTGLRSFVESSTLIELACLLSLIALCALRPYLLRLAPWMQRLACVLVPACVTWLLIRTLSANLLFAESFANLKPGEGALVAALFGAALQHYMELRTKAFSPVLAEARFQALQARIRPHFLFNSLNAVLSLIRSEPKRAENMLEDLAELFRVLMRDARDMTTLEKELRLCRQYLSIESVRLGERLQVQWNTSGIDEEAMRRAKIPSLLLQPLLENAVHYGVEPASAPALIQVTIARQLDRIEIEIINPRHAHAAPSDGNHMALTNIRQRLTLLYDVEAQLTAVAAPSAFAVRLHFPYVKR